MDGMKRSCFEDNDQDEENEYDQSDHDRRTWSRRRQRPV